MARRHDLATIYAAGVIQGLALVTFPAASTVFMASADYGLSRTEYGGLFLPQAILAISASLFGGALIRRMGAKRVYLVGLAANALSMAVLLLSIAVMHRHAWAYVILLTATGSMGLAFGWTVPALNTYAARLSHGAAAGTVLALNALLGLGTVLAPLLVALFLGAGFWWGLPVLVAALMLIVFLVSLAQVPADDPLPRRGPTVTDTIPPRFWLFSSLVLLYGICEAMNSTWAPLYMTSHAGAGATMATITLTAFWGMVTGGRLATGALSRWIPAPVGYRILPLVVMLAFLACATLPKHDPLLGVLIFALAGLGCSALLPWTISFAQTELTNMSATVASGLIAAYQTGYGIAAFGVGPLLTSTGLDLRWLYGGSSLVALVLAALTYFVAPISSATVPAKVKRP
jgi:MFS family permease